MTCHPWKIVVLTQWLSSFAAQLTQWFFTFLSLSLWSFCQTFSLKNVIFCSVFALLRIFWTFFVFTFICYEYFSCTTTNIYVKKHIFQKIKPSENCCWVKLKPLYNVSVLLIDSDLHSICGIRWPPEISGYRWPGASLCIQISSYMIWRPTGI